MADNKEDAELLDPNISPSKQNKVGVKKVNNWPLIIMFIGVGLFLLIMMLVGIDRAEQQDLRNNSTAKTKERFAGDTSTHAEAIIQGRTNGFTPAQDGEELGDDLSSSNLPNDNDIASEDSNDEQLDPEVAAIVANSKSLPNQRPTGDENQLEELKRQMRQDKLKQLKDAVRLSSNLSIQAGSSGGSSQYGISSRSSVNNTRNGRLNQLEEINRQLDSTKALLARDPIEQYKQTLAQIQNNGLVNSSGSAPASTPMALVDDSQASNTNGAYNQFDGQNSRWNLNSKVEKPKSPFQLHAGFVIPALMITGVNSDLAGQIMGQVSQNVYDSVTGEHLLIPQGSRLVGTYNSKVAFGQERVMVAWQRILFPDGKSMDIGSMQGADSAGYSGFKDLVNHHFWRVFGSAIMMSVITAAAELSQSDDSDDSNKERSALNEALGQQLGQAAAQMIMRNLNIAPTIEVRSGYRFNVMVSKDMVFTRPYQSYDY